jgi:NAD-dependent oxidoreductase involved in siderophore biosynthesis
VRRFALPLPGSHVLLVGPFAPFLWQDRAWLRRATASPGTDSLPTQVFAAAPNRFEW